MKRLVADIILPLAVKGKFSYAVPDRLIGKIHPGSTVVVQFGKRKFYTGIVSSVHPETFEDGLFKTIADLVDFDPLVNETQLKLWQWISEYYMCTIGEVMKAALPSGFYLDSETNKEKYRPKTEPFVILSQKYTEPELHKILDNLFRAPRQYELLTAYIEMTGYQNGADLLPVNKSELLKQASSQASILTTLENKGILNSFQQEVGRLTVNTSLKKPVRDLSYVQAESLVSINEQFKTKDTVLLAGVTSSGKTEIYIHLIEQELNKGKQVLYMLPEIAITGQIISRLENYFGPEAGVYHSRFSDAEKVEIWRKVADMNPDRGYRLIVGVRSSLFLPFNNLGLIIVDEEHDGSYKQQDPSPRYHARDSAIILASLHKAKVLLGTATPSIESYHNCITGKFGIVRLTERFGKVKLPEIVLANTREAYRKKRMVSHFTPELLDAVKAALSKDKQVVLFQNRRGFSPYIECLGCGWIPQCHQCAVKLTYHKGLARLVCHYCGYNEVLPSKCPNCGSAEIATRGFGTEKIEDEIKLIFPDVRVARLDHDTTRNINSLNRIISQFENHQIDILVGTQMISKGLDFENLTVVGILNADNMLNFPDFRAWEKSFQLLEQVSGRAGRRQEKGLVIVQTSDPLNNIIQLVLRHDYDNMYRSQALEREIFGYPPFTRLIRINIKHREWGSLIKFAGLLGSFLKESLGKRVLGPEAPVITKIHTWHIKTILIKIEKERSLSAAREIIWKSINRIEKLKGAGALKISIDVDPY
jgi:primosomal protein N' (replication factor Y) (superfamily II helicase)